MTPISQVIQLIKLRPYKISYFLSESSNRGRLIKKDASVSVYHEKIRQLRIKLF